MKRRKGREEVRGEGKDDWDEEGREDKNGREVKNEEE